MAVFVPMEELPDKCPPNGATQLSGLFVRLVAAKNYDDAFCASFAAQGKTPIKKIDLCIWAGCSLILYDETWVDGAIARVRDFAEGARLLEHKPYGAIMKIAPPDGLGRQGSPESPHFSFWMAKSFNPKAAVQDVVKLT